MGFLRFWPGVLDVVDFDFEDFCSSLPEEPGQPWPVVEKKVVVDPLASYPYRELRSTLIREFHTLPVRQGSFRMAFEHEVPPDGPEVMFERLAFIVVRESVLAWNTANGTNLNVVHQRDKYPDVAIYDGDRLALGVEIKTYDVLCKEQEPTARFKVTRAACGEGDLVVLLSYVWKFWLPGSGPPMLVAPWVESALEVVGYRDAYGVRKGKQTEVPVNVAPGEYRSRDRFNDHDAEDRGNNNGRIGRLRIPSLVRYLSQLLDIEHSPDGGATRVNLRLMARALGRKV